MHYVAERLGAVLGPDRAVMSEYTWTRSSVSWAPSDAWGNRRLAEEYSKSPRFRGVRADLGVVGRDQAEIVPRSPRGSSDGGGQPRRRGPG